MTISITPDIQHALEEEAARQGKTPEQLAMEAMLEKLRGRRVPQSLDEIKPHKPLPAGKTLKDVIDEFNAAHPSSETDEDVDRLLTELS